MIDKKTDRIQQVAELLNAVGRDAETKILSNLEVANPNLARKIRDRMFTFDDLTLIDSKQMQLVLKELNPETANSDIDTLIVALIGTTFFVASLLTSQDPGSIGATLFVVTITAFGGVNPGVSLGNMLASAIDGNADWAFYGIVGSLLGCGLGYAVKENVIDN